MSTDSIVFEFAARILPLITLTIFTAGIVSRIRRWMKAGNWPSAQSSLITWLPVFIKSAFFNLILFLRIYRRRKVFWILSFGFHITVFVILFGHLRGFGIWSKETIERISPALMDFMVEVLPKYLGVISTLLFSGLLLYRIVNSTLKQQSEIEDYLVTFLVLTVMASGTLMRLLPPDSLDPMNIRFLPGIILKIEKTPNIASLLIHIVSAQLLIMYLPFSKLVHIISAILNLTYSSIEIKAETFLSPSNKGWENEKTKKEGILDEINLTTLPGRYVLALESCVTCGNCTLDCPTYTLSKEKTHIPGARLKKLLRAYNQRYLVSRILGRKVDKRSIERSIFECSLCGYCKENCPLIIMTDSIYLAVRYILRRANWIPEQLIEFSKVTRESHNPLGRNNEERIGWIDYRASRNNRMLKKLGEETAPFYIELNKEDLIKDRAETVYFVGCNVSFFKALSGVPDAMVHILKLAKEDFTILGTKEWCCGYPLLLAGDINGFREMAIHNLEAIREKGARKVVFTCAGCYKAFKQLYRNLLNLKIDFEIMHSTQFLHLLSIQGKLKPIKSSVRVTYHDPCDIGRHDLIYLEPRSVLRFVGCELVEMKKIEEDSFCCGGGGLLKISNPDLSSQIAIERTKQAEETGAKFLITACPACELSLREGIQALKGSKLKVLDITEIVALQTGLLPASR